MDSKFLHAGSPYTIQAILTGQDIENKTLIKKVFKLMNDDSLYEKRIDGFGMFREALPFEEDTHDHEF